MFCQYQYYREDTEELQTMVAHSDENYKCCEMSDCPYTGTTLINNIQWGGKAGNTQEEDLAKEDLELALALSLSLQDQENSEGNKDFAHKRLLTDFSKLQNSPPVGVSGFPRAGDILTWDCVIFGLPDTFIEFGAQPLMRARF